ncbi:MAG: TRAM domain-containing protein [Nitrososphaeraceae archaeon]|nr:TRAM domain-containing protein [Nitrososphaeraceae archaeon]
MRSNEGSYGGGSSNRNYGNRGFSPYRRYPPAPVELEQEYNVKIEAMSRQGNAGIARIQGLVIFVDGTKVDDNVRIKIKKIGRGHAVGEIVTSEPGKEQEEASVSGKEQEEASVSGKEQEEASVSGKEQEE